MRTVTKKRYICEVAREINDLHQSDSEHDETIRQKLAEIQHMAKRMMQKLSEYKADKENKRDLFPEKTENYRQKKKLRKQEGYKKSEIQ